MIITLTVNPAIDVSTSVGKVVPIRKLRCATARHDPGGGGINAARVIRRLGGDVLAVYTAGGPTGLLLRRLVEREGLRDVVVEVAQDTRQDFTVAEDESGQQYRFVLPGLPLSVAEWSACLDALSGHPEETSSFLVASGSLPPGVPADFYQRVARIAKKLNAKMVLDTAGPPLAPALEERPYLIKPNLNELQQLAGRPLQDQSSWIDVGRSVVKKGGAELVALTLGDRGALLVSSEFANSGHRAEGRGRECSRRRRQLPRRHGLEPCRRHERAGGLSVWCRRRLRCRAQSWNGALSCR